VSELRLPGSQGGEVLLAVRRAVAVGDGEVQSEERARLNARIRGTLTQDRMNEFKSGKDLEHFIRQAEHELGLKGVVREDEMRALAGRLEFGRHKDAVLRRLDITGIEDADARSKAMENLIAEEERRNRSHAEALKRDLDAAKNEAEKSKLALELKRLEAEHDYLEAQRGQTLLERQLAIERADDEARMKYEQAIEEARLKARGAATADALLSIVSGPEADRIAGLERLRIQRQMTPEHLLLVVAEASPEAARALGQKYQAEAVVSEQRVKAMEDRLKEQRDTGAQRADRMERILDRVAQQMGAVAVSRAAPDQRQTVVAGGQPMVIPPSAGLVESADTKPCPHCGSPMRTIDQFCGRCGQKV